MRMTRISIGGVMGIVIFAALAFAALSNSSELLASSLYSLMVTGLLLTTAVVPFVRRPFWFGFAVFGWAYLIVAFGPMSPRPAPPPNPIPQFLLEAFAEWNPVHAQSGNGESVRHLLNWQIYSVDAVGRMKLITIPIHLMQTFHLLIVMAAASFGGLATVALARVRPASGGQKAEG